MLSTSGGLHPPDPHFVVQTKHFRYTDIKALFTPPPEANGGLGAKPLAAGKILFF